MRGSAKQKPYTWQESNTAKATPSKDPAKDKIASKQLIEKISRLLEKKEFAQKAAKIIERWLKK